MNQFAGSTAQRKSTMKKRSSTSLMCELTRLRSQQKYLECNQMKLNPDNFKDDASQSGATNETETMAKAKAKAAIVSQINEIEHLKVDIDAKLEAYRQDARNDVRDMWVHIDTIKDDVFQPERRLQLSLTALRERVIGVNTHLERLAAKNSAELVSLRQQFEQMESETKVLLK